MSPSNTKMATNFIGIISNGNNDTNNIFLQEPVLTLNVEKMESTVSPVIIRNSFSELSSPNFGTSPHQQHNNHHHQLFSNKSSSSGVDDDDDDDDDGGDDEDDETEAANKMPLDLSKPTQFDQIDSTTTTTTITTSTIRSAVAAAASQHTPSFFINENSNNSCDSGVVVEKVDSLSVGCNHIRKPITPHRILCPSPVKHVMPNHHHPYHNGQPVANNDKRNMKSKKR